MNQEEQKLLLNQVRHRILQFVLHKGNATAREIGAGLSDIPQASLYRQIKLLSDNDFIRECGQRQVRGTLEHTYEISERLMVSEGKEQTDLNIQFALLSLAQDLNDYYASDEDASKGKMVNYFSSPLMLSDEEYEVYISKINELTCQYMNKKPSDKRRLRRMTFVSSPA